MPEAHEAQEVQEAVCQSLQDTGYVVIPVAAFDLRKRQQARSIFRDVLRNMPEFKDTKAIDKPFVLGGFAALGNASSAHNSLVRRMRQYAMAEVVPLFRQMAAGDPTLRLEQVIDRMLYRVKGDQATAESWHRDESKDAAPKDDVFGGWWNLDDTDQLLSCVPFTHKGVTGNSGFATIKDKAEKKALKATAVMVRIPPGSIIVFYERLVHEVVAHKAKETMHRLFLGWRLTHETTPLIPDVEERLRTKAVMPLKSGQNPPMYAALHWTNWRQKIVDFSEGVRDEFKEVRVVGSGEEKGKAYHIVRRFMPNLEGVDALPEDSRKRKPYELCGPAYKRQEIDMHRPMREWELHRASDDTKHTYSL